MELRASVQSLSFGSSFGSSFGNPWRLGKLGSGDVGRHSSGRVYFPTVSQAVQLKRSPSVAEITPKQLQHRQKKQEWRKKQRRARRLAEQEAQKEKLAKNSKGGVQGEVWKSGGEREATLMSKFEEEFAMRVRDAENRIEPSATTTSEDSRGEPAENSTTFREDSHSVFEGGLDEVEDVSDDWLLDCEPRSNGHLDLSGNRVEESADDGDAFSDGGRAAKGNTHGADSGFNFCAREDGRISNDRIFEVLREERSSDMAISTNALPKSNEFVRNSNGTVAVPSTFSEQHESADSNSTADFSDRLQFHFIDHSFRNHRPIEGTSASNRLYNNALSTHSRDETDLGIARDDASRLEASSRSTKISDWSVNPKTPRRKDKIVIQRIKNATKGELLSTSLNESSNDAFPETHGILEALHEDVTSKVWRMPVGEREQLERLVEGLLDIGEKQKFVLSRLMHGARLMWTDYRLLELVKMLGARGEWRRAMEVVHWVDCREHLRHCRSRYVCTTLLAVLGKCLRPVEALNVFNVMREEHSTYPDMAAYHSIAVTLGKAGHLTQLLQLIESLREGPVKESVKGTLKQLNWTGRLDPDIVVYNAVINACGPHRQCEGTEWVFQQINFSRITPNSTTYDLAIEVMVKSGQYDKAWRYYEVMEREGFLPNALTFKALVEALGTTGEVDRAIEMVEDMELRGVPECAGAYYALASTLCTAGRLSEALVQVEKLAKLSSKKPDVITYTGLIQTCEKVGRWQDAISLFNRMQYVCAPNVGTYNTMISLYGRLRMFEDARNMFELVKKGKHKESRFCQSISRLSPIAHTYESMLGACAACEDWGYFEVVLREFHTHGFQLDRRRHTWFISPIVNAGQERLIHLMAWLLQRPDESPSAELFKVLLSLLSMHRQHTLVLHYLNVVLEQGVVLSTSEWSSIIGKALDQLPMVDAEQFIFTKVASVRADDNKLVKDLLQCLVSVEAEPKARRIVSLLGLQVGELVPFTDITLRDSRLLPQDDEIISENKLKKEVEIQEVSLHEASLTHNKGCVNTAGDLHFQVRSQDILQQLGEEALSGPRIDRRELGWNSRHGLQY